MVLRASASLKSRIYKYSFTQEIAAVVALVFGMYLSKEMKTYNLTKSSASAGIGRRRRRLWLLSYGMKASMKPTRIRK